MNYLDIYHFKCFRNIQIPINRLTALLGANGVGKSSVIQSLLLLKTAQTDYQRKGDYVPLNGPYGLTLGTATDIITADVSDGFVKTALTDGKKVITEVVYEVNGIEEELGLKVSSVNGMRRKTFLDSLYFLSAERLGPRISQPIHQMDELNVGVQGEYTAQVLDYNKGLVKVQRDRMFPNTKDPNLPKQVNFWLDRILKGVQVYAVADYAGLTASIKLENRYSGGNNVLPTNIGFGISYALPVITTGLIAKTGGLMIVENPEAHLHPAAQSAMGEFLGMVARSGVTVLVETHSDHIINGIQLDAARHPEFAEMITINNFSPVKGELQPKVDSISISDKGEIKNWPEGFMDQSQKDFMELMNINANK